MILAGDIGGTNARLAYFQPQNGRPATGVRDAPFPAASIANFGEIVSQFLDASGTRPEAACFGIAGPVRNGRVETSNLPWVIEQSRLAKQIRLPAAAHQRSRSQRMGHRRDSDDSDLVPLNRVSWPAVGNQAVIAPGTGLGEAGLFWDGKPSSCFRLRRRAHRFWSTRRFAD